MASAPPHLLSEENARLQSRHNIPVEDDITLPEGWVRNSVALRLSGHEHLDYNDLVRTSMQWEERVDPKYDVSMSY